MPRVRAAACNVHDEADCQCYKRPVAVAQSLEELDYLKSACAAAQQGNIDKLRIITDKHPEAVNNDGSNGKSIERRAAVYMGRTAMLTTSRCHRRQWLHSSSLCS